MKRKILLQLVVPLLSLCVLFMLFTGEPDEGQEKYELLEVSVIPREADGTIWSAVRQGMEQAAEDMRVELRFLTISETNQAEEQKKILEREVRAGAKAIVLFPSDRIALAESVENASLRTEIITMDTEMEDSGAAACIRVDQERLGADLGTDVLNGVPEGGLVLLLNGSVGNNGAEQRLEAAAEVLLQENRRVRRWHAERPELIREQLPELLETLQPNALMAFDASTLEQAAHVIHTVSPRPLLYGVGSSGAVAAHLELGDITQIAAWNEFAGGYLAIQAAAQAVRNTGWPAPDALAYAMVRKENMHRPDHEKLLFPVTR